MIIRTVYPRDIEELKFIHEKFYKDEFDFPDFYDKFLCTAIVIDGDEIICAGGLRTIVESLIITNKDISVKRRRQALIEMLKFSLYTANKCNYDQFHAFVQDDSWEKHLVRIGFRHTKGKALVYG